MVVKYKVEGYEGFLEFMEKFDDRGNPTFVHFSGTKLPNGDSWCPDCVEALPVIEKAINALSDDHNYILVEVGDRPYWKDLQCPFRTNKDTRLKLLPTLVKWKTQQRLEGDELLKDELIELLLMNHDD